MLGHAGANRAARDASPCSRLQSQYARGDNAVTPSLLRTRMPRALWH